VRTEMFDIIAETAVRDVVLYDGACGFCSRWLDLWMGVLGRHCIGAAPLQTPGVAEKLRLNPNELLADLLLLDAEGRLHRGVAAYLYVWNRIWWLRPLYWLFSLPVFYQFMQCGYAIFKANRYRLSRQCGLRPHLPSVQEPAASSFADWLPLLLLPGLALLSGNRIPAWASMWALAFGIFAGFKWLTWRRACRAGVRAALARHLAYLCAWPGMQAAEFLADATAEPPQARQWMAAVAKTLLGAALFWVLPRELEARSPMLAVWLGMAGVVLLLHFGLFHLLALAWQWLNVSAAPLMRAPLHARSLGDFWSTRWNVAMRDIVHGLVLQPLRRRWGLTGATLAVFLVSGLIHDLVISVPARAGYGWPTAYFALQGAGVLFERSAWGRALGLARGWRGQAFALAVTALPVPGLFHPAFIGTVFVPFMHALGAL